MAREVDGHSDPCTQNVARPTHHRNGGRPPLVEDAETRSKDQPELVQKINLKYVFL